MNRTFFRAAFAVAALAFAGLAVATAGPDPVKPATTPPVSGTFETAIFASGCFWCTESDFDKVDGVLETISGYIGGKMKNPTYELVSSGITGHTEALLIKFDPTKVTYSKLLHHYWRNVDLLDGSGQFCDRGSQYRPAIFTTTQEQAKLAEHSKTEIEKSGRFDKKVAVEILPASEFTAAEGYHQDYHNTNPVRYMYYRNGCGRDARLRKLWGTEATH